MKNYYFLTAILFFGVVVAACVGRKKSEQAAGNSDTIPVIISGQMKYCESTYPYNDGFIVGNFGSSALNPLNKEGKGYLLFLKDTTVSVLVPSDGNLNAPRGIYERDGYLFVSDVNKIVVYNLKSLKEKPQTVQFSKEDMFINDLAAVGDTLFASVTNTGKIFAINIKNPANVSNEKPVKYLDIPGPNGLTIADGRLYIASYPPDGKTTSDNVVWVVNNLKSPKAEKLINETGQYDGIAVSDDGATLYVSNWSPAGIVAVDLKTKMITPVNLRTKVDGPADFTLKDGKLIIPDLANSRVIMVKL